MTQLNFWNLVDIFSILACNCNSIGSNGISCNISTGECECNIGYSGTQCNNCADEYYGWPTCNGKLYQI